MEALCLSMVLYGAPLQALDSVSESVGSEEGASQEIAAEAEGPSPLKAVFAETHHAVQETTQHARRLASDITRQPWSDALRLLLTASSLGATGSNAPPSPPTDASRQRKDFDLASLTAGFPDTSALDAVPLLPGWNQISLPETPSSSDPAIVLAAIGGSYDKVYAYDGCDSTDPWEVYDLNDLAGSDLATITIEQGLLVDATAAVNLPSDGVLPDATTFNLCSGWNLIGFPAAQPRHVKNTLAPILDKVVRIFAFDPFDLDDHWKFFEASAPAWASDLDLMEPGKGYWILVTEDVTFDIKNVGEAPAVTFTSPQDLDVVTAPTEIHGTVASDLLESWQLRWRGVGETDWIGVSNGNYPVDGKLGTFDPTLLLNGMYELELLATDLQGRQVSDSIAIVVEGNMKIGHFTLSFVDLAIPLSGLDIEVVRTYDSRQRHLQGDFGQGWSLDIRQGSYRNNRPPGDGWQILATGGPFGLPCQVVQETKSHLTTVRLSDQEVYRFRLTVKDPGTIIGGCIGRAEFEYVDGPVPGATLEILGDDAVLYQNDTDELRDPDTFATFVPEDVELTTRDGRIFHLNLATGVTHLEDLNGNILEITEDGITHSSGLGIEFVRDAEGRIERIVDTENEDIEYRYSQALDLESVKDQEDTETRFIYDEDHFLREIIDAEGTPQIQLSFQSSGRLDRIDNAVSGPTFFDHDVTNRREIIKDRLGRTRILEYDGRGNVVRATDRLGRVIERTFDARDRLLSETIAGATTTLEYDAMGDLIKLVDPLGSSTEFTYNGYGDVQTLKDPNGNVTTTTFDSMGRVESILYADGGRSRNAYNSRGDVVSVTDEENHVTRFVHDSYGRVIEVIDALGNSTTFVTNSRGQQVQATRFRSHGGSQESLSTSFDYDRAGRMIRRVDPDGSAVEMAYGPTGLLETLRDKRGYEIQYRYNAGGLPLRTTYSDGSSSERVYNQDGRLQSLKGRDGHWTQLTYSAEGELISVIHPDGAVSQMEYDLAGRVARRIDGKGNGVRFEYDAAGRLSKTIGASGWEEVNTYDAMGNLIEVGPPDGRTERFDYDARHRILSRSVQSIQQARNTYDLRGFVIGQSRPNGSQTSLARDALGRLTTIVDALGNTSSFAYDEVGNKIRQVDAAGNVTRFEYDRMGRKIRHILPDDTVFAFEYDAAGNVVTQHRPDGSSIHLSYDSNNRIIERKLGTQILAEMEYSPSGRLLKSRNGHGEVARSFDTSGRLQQVRFPDGALVGYTYDLAGNRTSVSVDGQSTQYQYDSDNRLDKVIAPGGLAFQYAYDAVGRRTSLTYPNGVDAHYAYDSLGRLQQISVKSQEGIDLHREVYERDSIGNLTKVSELDSIEKMYSYDVLDRLIEERVLDGSAEVFSRNYSYDSIGNRSAMTETSGSSIKTTTYQYDVRGRLIEDSQGNTYQWDALGRLKRKDTSGTEFRWSPEGKLIQTSTTGRAEDHIYDSSGRRLGNRVTLDSGEVVQTSYSLDISSPVHQILAERSADTSLDRYHVREAGLLATLASTGTTYHHTDALGTVRLRTDESGEIVDRLNYTAFGEVLDVPGESATPGFVGEAFSPNSGQYDLRARWYDPSLGRFLSADPFPGFQTKPSTWNKYSYVENNPVNRIDPLGLFSASQWMVVTAVTLSVTATVSLNALTTFGAFELAASSGERLSGFLASGRFNIHGLGGTLGEGLDGVFDFNTRKLWFGGTLEVGLYPLSIWKSSNGRAGLSHALGPVLGMESPKELAGRGYTAVWPVSVLKLMPSSLFDSGPAWGLLSQLAKRSKSGRGWAVQIGFSTSGPSYFLFAQRSNDFSNLATYSTDFVPYDELPTALQAAASDITTAFSDLFALGPEVSLLMRDPELFFGLLSRGVPK